MVNVCSRRFVRIGKVTKACSLRSPRNRSHTNTRPEQHHKRPHRGPQPQRSKLARRRRTTGVLSWTRDGLGASLSHTRVSCKKINRSHTHTSTDNNTPDTAHDKNNTPNPQTNTSHKHSTTLGGGATTVRATTHARVGGRTEDSVGGSHAWWFLLARLEQQ